MKTKKKKSNWIKFIVFLVIIFLVLMISSIALFINYKTSKVNKSLSYNETGELSYLVCLNKNDIIKDECISEKRSFISDMIDKIKFKLDYSLKSTDIANYNYSYEILAETIINEKGSSDKILCTLSFLDINKSPLVSLSNLCTIPGLLASPLFKSNL